MKGNCRDCIFLRQEYVLGWTGSDLDNDLRLFVNLDTYCWMCGIFKSLDGYCDCWEPND